MVVYFWIKNVMNITKKRKIIKKNMNLQFHFFKRLVQFSGYGLIAVLALLQGCANHSSELVQDQELTATKEVEPAAGFFVPVGTFEKLQGSQKVISAARLPKTLPMSADSSRKGETFPFSPQVWLYASPSTQSFLSSGGLDAKTNLGVWGAFLRKYKIPFKQLTSADQIDKTMSGVLLLPSSVALSEAEKLAIVKFRAKGGSVLATWLAGVRDEKSQWQGFDFMEKVLGVKVLGDTKADEEDNFMSTYGDNPVTHALPAGQRVWLERAKGWYPLRLAGGYPAAEVTDWSRNFTVDKSSTTVVFDERLMPSGAFSRAVVFGYPERLWLSADPQQTEAIAHNALMWLLRQPDAYLAAWPYPYVSALVMAIDAAEVMLESDLAVTQKLEDAGGHGTYFVLSDAVDKSVAMLKKLQARGHEIAYMGDSFAGFRDQSTNTQAKRLDTMQKTFQSAGIEPAPDAGFHAPMESYDKTTEKLLQEGPFGYYVAFMDATDTRLPVFAGGTSIPASQGSPKVTVILPRTQSGPDDLMEENDPADAMKIYLGALDLSERMAALSVIRLPNQSLLTPEQLAEVFGDLKNRKNKSWLITAANATQWWRERDLVKVDFDAQDGIPVLTVTVRGTSPVARPMSVWVNLPDAHSVMRLKALNVPSPVPKVMPIDVWRSAVLLEGLKPGRYQWQLAFESNVQ